MLGGVLESVYDTEEVSEDLKKGVFKGHTC